MSHIIEPSRRGRLARRIVLLLFVVAAAATAVISLRPRRGTMERWMNGMRAKGERFTLQELVPSWKPSTNDIMDLIESAATQFKRLTTAGTNRQSGVRQNPNSKLRTVAWAEPNLCSATGVALDWETLDYQADQMQGVLNDLRAALSEPPSDTGLDYSQPTSRLNFVAKREVAHRLFDLTVYDLRNHNLTNAQENLRALIGMARLHSEDRTISGQMIRSAIEGLAAEAVWQALPAKGWTDEQLAAVQADLTRISIFPELAAALRVERAHGLKFFEVMRKDSGWNANVFGFGLPLGGGKSGIFDHAGYLLWQQLWSERDGLLYVQVMQIGIDCLDELERRHSFADSARGPKAAYDRLEREAESPVKYRYLWSLVALPNYVRIFENAVRNETWRQLAIGAIALERFKLRHGSPPARLSDLQPEFLSELPVDCYNGRPLRFRLNADGGFDLYSVGENFRDDGGNGSLDLVWPKPLWPAQAGR